MQGQNLLDDDVVVVGQCPLGTMFCTGHAAIEHMFRVTEQRSFIQG